MLHRTKTQLGSEGGPSGSPSLPKRATAVIVLAVLLFGGGAILSSFDPPVAKIAAPDLAAEVVGVPGEDAPKASVDSLERVVEAGSDDPEDHSSLALLYLQAVRSEADPTYLSRAETLLKTSLELQPDGNFPAYVGMASLSNGRHDFLGSVRWSRRAIATNSHNATPYGLLGDALFELGRTGAADRAYQRMIDIRPDLASYVRASYSFQYRGETDQALSAMRLALESAGPAGEGPAWIRHQKGDIHFGIGDLDDALRQNKLGRRLAPGYVPPTVGVAEVLTARGRIDRAIPILERAAERLPSLEYMVKLGDLYTAEGRKKEAAAQYQRVGERLALYRANGVLPDIDFILFYADHGLRPRAALDEVRTMYAQRPTAGVAEAYAWMLHSLGRDDEALPYARRSVRGPSISADPFYQAGVIAAEAGLPKMAQRYMRAARSQEWNLRVLYRRR